jgi:chromosome partitioning protein
VADIVIGTGSQKGGVGKSAINRGLAVGYAMATYRVLVADFDVGQKTITKWLKRREARETFPSLDVEAFGSVEQAIAAAADYDVLILDGAAAASELTVSIAQASDLFIMPTGLGLDDLEPAVELADAMHFKHGVAVERLAFAFSHSGDSEAELQEARDYLGHRPYHVLAGHIRFMTSYRRAMDVGKSIIEVSVPTLRVEAETLIQSIIHRAHAATTAAA